MSLIRLSEAQIAEMFRDYVTKHYSEMSEERFCYFYRTTPSKDVYEISIADDKDTAYQALVKPAAEPEKPKTFLQKLFGK